MSVKGRYGITIKSGLLRGMVYDFHLGKYIKEAHHREIIQCSRKKQYGTIESAKKGLESLVADKSYKIEDFDIYLCPYCYKHHFGHKSKRYENGKN